MNHQQHLASLDKGMSSAERASLVRSNSSSMSSQMAAITAVRLQVRLYFFTCYSKGDCFGVFFFPVYGKEVMKIFLVTALI